MLFCSVFLVLMVVYNYAAINLAVPPRQRFFQGLYHLAGALIVGLVVSVFYIKTRTFTAHSVELILGFCSAYWIAFDVLLNLSRQKEWWYVGENAKLDRFLAFVARSTRLPLPYVVPAVKLATVALAMNVEELFTFFTGLFK